MNGAHLECTGRRLMRWGMVLFLLGLLTGFAVPILANPRMGLSSHLEGVLNGLVLLVLGVIWTKLRIGSGLSRMGFYLSVYGTYINWATTLIAAVWGAGGRMMPLAAPGHEGTDFQESLIAFGLISLSVAMVVVSGIVIHGLRGSGKEPDRI